MTTKFRTKGRGRNRKVYPVSSKPKRQMTVASALTIHQMRPTRAQAIDNKMKAGLASSPEEWAKQPNRSDLKGVDYNPYGYTPHNTPTKKKAHIKSKTITDYPLDKYGWRKGEKWTTKIWKDQDKYKVAVYENGRAGRMTTKTFSTESSANAYARSYLRVKFPKTKIKRVGNWNQVGKKLIPIKQPTEANPLVIENYPWGFRLKTQQRVWVETTKNGQRVVRQTKNPKTGEWCKPKKSTYSDIEIVYKNLENNHIESDGFSIQYSGREDYDRFLRDFPMETLTEYHKQQLAKTRAVMKTREHLKVTISDRPHTAEGQEERKKKNEETMKDMEKIYGYYRVQEKRQSGY